jgi:Cdc6-like AAA superfamily ATPase
VLGWSELNITREHYNSNGYYDYLFDVQGFKFVVEAKRNHTEFTIPINNEIVAIDTLHRKNKEIFAQLRGYLLDNNTAFGICTNGKQFIIGQFINLDGKKWTDNKVLIFNGLDDVEDRFVEFYNNLSFCVISSTHQFEFLTQSESKFSDVVISKITKRDSELNRNKLSSSIGPIISEIFGELFDEDRSIDKELIKQCFVENTEIKKNKDAIEKLFGDIPPELENVSKGRNSKGLLESFENEIKTEPNGKSRPVIVIGSRGAGKSTFINFFLFNWTNEYQNKKKKFAYIDVRRSYEIEQEFSLSKLAETVFNQITKEYPELKLHKKETLEKIYAKEIKEKKEGVWSYYWKNDKGKFEEELSTFLSDQTKNYLQHIEKISHFILKIYRNKLVLILDNGDQLEDHFQSKLYKFANTLCSKSAFHIFISLREGYYYRYRNTQPFDAYVNNVYHISSPDYGKVLSKRLAYTLDKIPSKEESITSTVGNKTIKFNMQDLLDFLSSLNVSIFSSGNTEIVDFLQYTSFPNVREGLRLFSEYLISGYTNVGGIYNEDSLRFGRT